MKYDGKYMLKNMLKYFWITYLKLNILYLYCFWCLCNISFVKHLPEDRHKGWPKHIRGLQHLQCNKFTYLHMHLLFLFSEWRRIGFIIPNFFLLDAEDPRITVPKLICYVSTTRTCEPVNLALLCVLSFTVYVAASWLVMFSLCRWHFCGRPILPPWLCIEHSFP